MVKSIDEVFENPFSDQTILEKIQTLLEGKPRPPLPNVFINCIEFDGSFYDKELWITACERRRTFFCWSCLLFVPENKSEWTKEGYGNYELLLDGMEKHKRTVSHISGIKQLENFVREQVIPSMPVSESKKSYLRKRLLDFMLVLLSHTTDYPLPKRNEFNLYILEKCTRDLMLLKEYEEEEYGKVIDIFSRPDILTNYINTLARMMKTMIMEEILNTPYISLIISEHFSNKNGTLISVMFRYMKNEEICHRFWRFEFMTTILEVSDFVANILKEFQIKKDEGKFIAFSFNSAMRSVCQLRSFVSGMKQDYGVIFSPCYFDSFETIVERTISEIDTRSRHFFKTVIGIRDYVKRSPKIQTVFNDFAKGQFDLDANQSTFKFIILLKNNEILFCQFFNVIKQNRKQWLDDDVVTAIGFAYQLDDPEFLTSMEILSALSPTIAKISDILCSSTPERILRKYLTYKKIFKDMKTDTKFYLNICESICAKMKIMYPNIFATNAQDADFRTNFRERFDEILDCVVDVLQMRIKPLVKYSDYLSICSSNFEKLLPKDRKDFSYFPTKITLNTVDLQKEIYELRGKYPTLTGKRDNEVYKLLVQEKLKDTYATLFKTLQITLSTPFKTTSLDRSMTQQASETRSKLNAVNFWSKLCGVVNQEFANNWSFICIERDFLNSFMTNEGFWSDFHYAFERDHDIFQGL